MRKINAIITALIMILFLVHLIWGGLVLIGAAAGGSSLFSFLSRAMVFLIMIHMIIGIKLTADTVKACRKSGVSYWKENRVFWIRRLSGFALFIFILAHVIIFLGRTRDGVYLLTLFTAGRLVLQILMVVSLLVHLLTNIPPLRIAFGLKDEGSLSTDIILVLAVLLLLAGVAFGIYFVRWLII